MEPINITLKCVGTNEKVQLVFSSMKRPLDLSFTAGQFVIPNTDEVERERESAKESLAVADLVVICSYRRLEPTAA